MCGCDVLMLPLVLPLVLPLALALLGASRAPVRCIEWAGGRARSPTTAALTTARAQMQGQGAGACRHAARKVQPREVRVPQRRTASAATAPLLLPRSGAQGTVGRL